MLNFEQATEKLGNKTSRKLENNTYLERLDNDTLGVRLHRTYVVKIHRDGTFTLDNGGWRTVTTKDRINSYAPVRLYQQKHVWYLGNGEGGTMPFERGMKVDGFGKPLTVAKAS
jgi:hypothetical protein